MSKKPDWSEFTPGTKSEWQQELNKSLKTPLAPWHPAADIELKPIYFREDTGHNSALGGKSPFLRGNKTWGNDWLAMEFIHAGSTEITNQKVLNALSQGVDALCIDVRNFQPFDLTTILDKVIVDIIRIDLIVSSQPKLWLQELDKNAGEGNCARGSVIFDPFLACESSSEETVLHSSFQDWFEFVKLSSCRSGRIRSAVVSTITAHNAGADASLELALALSKAHDLLVFLLEHGLSIDEATALFEFRMGIGTSFFTELAKFRAIRPLWAKVISAYNPLHNCSGNVLVHAESAIWNMSATDVHTNLLRHTTEAMSAVYGGIDSLLILPFDKLQNGGSNAALRSSRNIQFLLKEESFAAKVADPAGGAMFVEEFTDQISEAAWNLFLEFENAGGYTQSVINGLISGKISKRQAEISSAILENKRTWLGVNKYRAKGIGFTTVTHDQTDKLYPMLELEKLIIEKEG